MRVPRIYVPEGLGADRILSLPESAHRHLLQVLRLRKGDSLVVFDGTGYEYPGTLIRVDRREARVHLGQPGERESLPPLSIRLGIGISKGDRMDYSLQKAVELGVSEITPLWMERTLVRLSGQRLARRESRWREILIGACEQSGRRRLPHLHRVQPLRDWLGETHPVPLLLDPRGDVTLDRLPPPADGVTLLVGPEGGFTPRERDQAIQAHFTPVRLGPRILRTETAPLAALAAIQILWGDFKG